MTLGVVRQVNIGQEMREAYLDYAMSVIVARALPDARDGLKPVHRRILYAMYDLGIRSDSAYKKCARIVGEVLGKYHPHGDGAVYEALVRMAQDFSLRYPLIDGQGNFGSIDGDGAAAMRYTESRMMQMGEELLSDIEKQTVNFSDNFDGTLREPTVLPSSLPNLLLNGSSGIAVGMSTNIPPHNINEICDALVYMLNKWDNLDDVTVHDLMQFVKGPDFPTGGLVYHQSNVGDPESNSLISAYATGRGRITMRAKVHLEEMGRGKSRLIVSELPYQTNKASLIERIATLARDGRIEGIADLRDESDRQGLRLTIELQRNVEPEAILKKLFQLTPLQETYGIIMLALVNGEPRTLSLKQALKVYLDHRIEVVRRRSEYDLNKAKDRAHILEGLLKALDMMDEVIQTIRASRNVDTARTNLMRLLKITDVQARAILDMQLRRLAALERKAIDDEYKEKRELITYLEDLLATPTKMRQVISDEMLTIKQAYGDPRRTVIVDSEATAVTSASMLMPQEKTWVTLTVEGKLGRTFDAEAPKILADNKEAPAFIVESDTAHIIYLFSEQGMCTTLPVHQIPQTHEPSEGTSYHDQTDFRNGEQITAMLSLSPNQEDGLLFFATRGGEVKRLRISDLPGMMANAFKVMDVEPDDALQWVIPTTNENEVTLTTREGQTIRFKETDVRPTGVGAGGMRGIKLGSEQDQVIGAGIASDERILVVATETGVLKGTAMSEYPTQGRAGSGVITMKLPTDSPALVTATVIDPNSLLVVLTNKGRGRTIRYNTIPIVKRAAKGEPIITLVAKESVKRFVTYDKQTEIIPQPTEEEAPAS